MSYPTGSLVKHINRPDVEIWVVTCSMSGAHILQSIPNIRGEYEIIRGDYPNLIPVIVNNLSPLRNPGKYVL